MTPQLLLSLALLAALVGVLSQAVRLVPVPKSAGFLKAGDLAAGMAMVLGGSALLAGRTLIQPVGWWYVATGSLLAAGAVAVALGGAASGLNARAAILGGGSTSLFAASMLAARCDQLCSANLPQTFAGPMVRSVVLLAGGTMVPAACDLIARLTDAQVRRDLLAAKREHAAVLAVLAVCAGAVLGAGRFVPARMGPQQLFTTAMVAVNGDPLSPGDRAGMTAPSITAYDEQGEMATIAPGAAHIVVLGAAWCEQCETQLEVLELYKRASTLPEQIRVSYVETYLEPGRQGFYGNQKLLDAEEAGVQVIVDDDQRSVASALGADAAPSWLLIGPDAKVVVAGRGLLDGAELADLVEQAVIALSLAASTPAKTVPANQPPATLPPASTTSTVPQSTVPQSTVPGGAGRP